MLGLIEVSLEWSSLVIFEWHSKAVKELPLLVLWDNINEGDKILTTVDSPEPVSDEIRVDSFNWNSEGVLLGISDDATIGLFYNKILGFADFFKLV